MVEFRIEEWNDDFIESLKPLLEEHYQEIALHKDVVKLDPDWERYGLLAKNKTAVFIGARDNGKLIGYSVFFLVTHIHYKQLKMASNDVLYLDPEYRKGMTGIKLIKASEEILKKLDVQKILWHIKFAKDFRKILYRMGYEDEDAIVGKILKD